MPKTYKFQTDGIVHGNEIPDDIEELELDCKAVAAKAFANRKNLRTLKLFNAETIGEGAFRGCRRLYFATLPDSLHEIGNRAFRDTPLNSLKIPRGVTKLGTGVISGAGFYFPVLEIYSEEKEAPLFFDGSFHLADHTKLLVHSPKTEKILYQCLVFNRLEDVLTPHGADFSEYDQKLLKSFDTDDPYRSNIDAARLRIHYPAGINGETLELFKDHVSEYTKRSLQDPKFEIIQPLFSDIVPYCDDLRLKAILELIPYFEDKFPDASKTLTKMLYYKINNDLDNISRKDLAETAKLSAKTGMTELTALLMEKLHEKGGIGGDVRDLEV